MTPEISEILERGYTKTFKTEQLFRSLVVDRLIEAPGWDLYEDVEPEAAIPAGSTTLKVDYVVGSNSFKFAIEAKRPSANIMNDSKLQQQLSSYLRISREVDYGLLYNGKVMLFMGKESETAITIWKQEEGFENINLFSKKNFPKNVESLLRMSPVSNLSSYLLKNNDILVDRVLEEIATDTGLSLDSLRNMVTVDISANAGNPQPSKPHKNSIKSIELSKARRRPARIKRLVIGGEKFNERKAKQVLIQTAEWLIRNGAITKKTKVHSGDLRYILNNSSSHPDGAPFYNEARLSNGMFLETNNPHELQEKYARKLLKDLGYNADLLEVEWEEL